MYSPQLISTKTLWNEQDRYQYYHVTDEKNKAQKVEVLCPKPQGKRRSAHSPTPHENDGR